ncbi:helix-turn-helix transcriptional regulator [Corynebacterium hindlerae]|uniref:Helix-turn-helix transcriptional regulator n=1 Tax=Corynebacterium hindlerae TaxID=699041 RepID=A0A7G5FC37_9CORY|nr:type II toxin-antitoxin system Y4mF family antitoxin [Corynebacterium hindlerae]QMV84178.1 helix-turn-helix transcriptional regulator [Corynebacterium hindlerae]
MELIHETIRTRRKELDLTQEDLADLAQVSERLVRSIEAGKETVRVDKLRAVLAVLGLELTTVIHVPEALR